MNDFELEKLNQQVAGLHEVIEALLLKLDCCCDCDCIDAEEECGDEDCCCDSSEEESSKGWGYPITKNEAIDAPGNQKEQQFMASDGTGRIGPRPLPTSVEWLKKVRMTGEEEDLPEP